MSDRRPAARRSGDRDDWTPPPWNRDPPAAQTPRPRSAAPRGPDRMSRESQEAASLAGSLIPSLATALIAGLALAAPPLSARSGLPAGLILMIAIQLGGVAIARGQELGEMAPTWFSLSAATSVILPLLALWVALLREPYVSLDRKSATPAMFATIVVAAALLILAVWSVASNRRISGQAALLFMPAGLLVPVMIGLPQVIDQRAGLFAIGEVAVLSALATGVASIAPPAARPFAPPAALALAFVLLWTTGRGPRFDPTSGAVVRWLATFVLAFDVVLMVATPIAALGIWSGRSAGPSGPGRRRRTGTEEHARR